MKPNEVVGAGMPTKDTEAGTRKGNTVDSNKAFVVAVKMGTNRRITDVKLNTGQICTLGEAVEMAEAGQLEGVNTGFTAGKYPHKTLRSYPDGDPSNNLSNLPTFE